jgi:hypothetical protein
MKLARVKFPQENVAFWTPQVPKMNQFSVAPCPLLEKKRKRKKDRTNPSMPLSVLCRIPDLPKTTCSCRTLELVERIGILNNVVDRKDLFTGLVSIPITLSWHHLSYVIQKVGQKGANVRS